MFKEAVAKHRGMQIKYLDADDQAGYSNGTGNRSVTVVGRAEPTDGEAHG